MVSKWDLILVCGSEACQARHYCRNGKIFEVKRYEEPRQTSGDLVPIPMDITTQTIPTKLCMQGKESELPAPVPELKSAT